MAEKADENYEVEITNEGTQRGQSPEPQTEFKGTGEPIMVPLAELQKLRAEKRSLKEQNVALNKMLEAQQYLVSQGDETSDDDLVTRGDLKKLQLVHPQPSSLPKEPTPKNVFRIGDAEVVELETEFKRFVPDYEKVIATTKDTLSKDPNMVSAIQNADNPPSMAYTLGKQLLAAGKLEGPMSETNPTETKEKLERIEFNQSLPRNINRSSGGGRNIVQFNAAEIAALPQDEFNEIWEKMTPSAREKLKQNIQTRGPVGKFPHDMK